MKVVIAGSRHFIDYEYVRDCVNDSKLDITEIISGGASGVDFLAIMYAKEYNIPYKVINAEWNQYERAAGPIRNKKMAKECDALIAIKTSGEGTQSMIREAKALNRIVITYD